MEFLYRDERDGGGRGGSADPFFGGDFDESGGGIDDVGGIGDGGDVRSSEGLTGTWGDVSEWNEPAAQSVVANVNRIANRSIALVGDGVGVSDRHPRAGKCRGTGSFSQSRSDIATASLQTRHNIYTLASTLVTLPTSFPLPRFAPRLFMFRFMLRHFMFAPRFMIPF